MYSHRFASQPAALRAMMPAAMAALFWAAFLWLLTASPAPAQAAAQHPRERLPASTARSPHELHGVSAEAALTSALTTDIIGLDPALQTDAASLLVTAQIYDTLVRLAADSAVPQAGLAQSWTVTADGLDWTFNLHPGVTFHDGSAVDAASVVDNVTRWWDPAHPQHQGEFVYFTAYFGGFKGDPACILAAVNALSPTQVQFVFSRRFDALPTVLALPAFAIASPQAMRSGSLDTQPVGSGPYRFVQHIPGQEVRLAANPAYWDTPPRVTELVFAVIESEAQRLAALQSGAIHAAEIFSPSLAQQITHPSLKILWRPTLAVGYLGINRAHGALGNVLVREAIAHAIHRQALIERHYPFGAATAGQLVLPSVWGSDPSLAGYTYDPALARSLLVQAGYPNGFTTTLAYRDVVRSYLPNPAPTAQSIRADLLAVGIDAQVVQMESSQFLDKVYAGELDLFLLGWGADYPHPFNFLGGVLCAGDKAFGEPDATLCDRLAAAGAEPDFAGQLAAYRAASRRVQATLPLLPLVHTQEALVLRTDVVLQPAPVGEAYREAFFAEIWALAPTAGMTATVAGERVTTTLQVAAGAVATDTQLLFAAMQPGPLQDSSVLTFTGHAFSLSAFQGSNQIAWTPTTPITLVIDYGGIDMSELEGAVIDLYYWNGARWSSEGIRAIERDPAGRRLVVTVAHLSDFALFGQDPRSLHLPLLAR